MTIIEYKSKDLSIYFIILRYVFMPIYIYINNVHYWIISCITTVNWVPHSLLNCNINRVYYWFKVAFRSFSLRNLYLEMVGQRKNRVPPPPSNFLRFPNNKKYKLPRLKLKSATPSFSNKSKRTQQQN